MTRRHIATLALIGMLTALLAACGGAAPAAPTAAPAPEAPVAQDLSRAPAPTAAPAAGADGIAAPAAEALPAPIGTTVPPAAGEAAPPPGDVAPITSVERQVEPLRAGEVDDNLEFDTYQQYLAGYYGGGVRKVDVTERYILTVVNESGQPVIDATVRLSDGQQQIFEGTTYAGGRTIIFPRAIGIPDSVGELQITVEKGQASASGRLVRGQDARPTIVLAGATAVSQPLRLDVLFLLDATGSMGDEITQIQSTIEEIAGRIDQFDPRPELRLGLVSYRDSGDAYVTNLDSNFTSDVAGFREALLQVRADGGGDTPEDLNSGLEVAIRQMSWQRDSVRLIFLVADAPAHLDYGQEFDYATAAREAVLKGIKIYPIGASNTSDVAEYQFRQLAQQTLGSFIFLTYQPGQSGGAPGDSTTLNVDPDQFTVDRLDDIVVRAVQRELRLALGVQ